MPVVPEQVAPFVRFGVVVEVDQQNPRAVTVAPPSEAMFAPNNAVLEVTLAEVGVLIVGASGQAEVVP